MSSGTNTPNLGLHNWNGSDYVLRTEFNDNFSSIDTWAGKTLNKTGDTTEGGMDVGVAAVATSTANFPSYKWGMKRSTWDSTSATPVTGTSYWQYDANGTLNWCNEEMAPVWHVDQGGECGFQRECEFRWLHYCARRVWCFSGSLV